VQIAFGEPIPVATLEATPETAGRVIEEELWPEVTAEYTRLRARPGLVAGVAALGLAGLITRRRRKGKRR
jgi:1-acyl-sn-glycerol-3-phosphate acyltransferase